MRRVNVAVVIVVAIHCVQPRTIAAQSSAEVQVRAVVDSFFTASGAERWNDAAKLLDMRAFDRILKQAQGNARAILPTPPMTVEMLMAHDSTMPRAVAEWQIARWARYPHDPYEFLTYQFANVSTPRDLLALTPDEAAARWLEAQDFRYEMRRSWKLAGCSVDMPASMIPVPRSAVFAVAVGNDSTAYVIHGGGIFDGDIASGLIPPLVMVLTRRDSTWRINPNFRSGSGALAGFGTQCRK